LSLSFIPPPHPKIINRDVKSNGLNKVADRSTLYKQAKPKLKELSEDNIFYDHLQALFYETLLKNVGTQRIYTAIPLYLLSFLSAMFG